MASCSLRSRNTLSQLVAIVTGLLALPCLGSTTIQDPDCPVDCIAGLDAPATGTLPSGVHLSVMFGPITRGTATYICKTCSICSIQLLDLTAEIELEKGARHWGRMRSLMVGRGLSRVRHR